MTTPNKSTYSSIFCFGGLLIFCIFSMEPLAANTSLLSLPKDTWQFYSMNPSKLVLLVIPHTKSTNNSRDIVEIRKKLRSRDEREAALKLVSAEIKITRKHPVGLHYQKDFADQIAVMLDIYNFFSQEPVKVNRKKNEDGSELVSVRAVIHDRHFLILSYGDQEVVLTGLFSSMRTGDQHFQDQRVFKEFFLKLAQTPWDWPGWPTQKSNGRNSSILEQGKGDTDN